MAGQNPSFVYKSSGVNRHGNHYCARDYGTSARNSNAYHYSNKDGGFYYSNPDGSKYYRSPTGESRYTAPSDTGDGSGSAANSGK